VGSHHPGGGGARGVGVAAATRGGPLVNGRALDGRSEPIARCPARERAAREPPLRLPGRLTLLRSGHALPMLSSARGEHAKKGWEERAGKRRARSIGQAHGTAPRRADAGPSHCGSPRRRAVKRDVRRIACVAGRVQINRGRVCPVDSGSGNVVPRAPGVKAPRGHLASPGASCAV
jgi:hypothetical protein